MTSLEISHRARQAAAAELELRHRRQEYFNDPDYLGCKSDVVCFIENYISIYDATSSDWVPFLLWDAQKETLRVLQENKLTVLLKARQLGLSWLLLAYGLWRMIFHPAATFLIFSKGDKETVDMLDVRLKGMYEHMDRRFKQYIEPVETDQKHEWLLGNGSRALAFSTKGGRGYTATFAMVDEADYIPDLGKFLTGVKPTVDAGGTLVLISTPDKSKPMSTFKRIYITAKQGLNSYTPLFYSWRARPDRTDAWYEEQRRDSIARTGALDDLNQEYPTTDTEALAPRTLDKRIAPAWVEQCYTPQAPLAIVPYGLPSLTANVLKVYRHPSQGIEYVLGADPAEGNPTSDDSALTVLERMSGEEVCSLAGKFEPSVFASYIRPIAIYYNNAKVLVERNNHGHAVLLWLTNSTGGFKLLHGTDGKPGWLTTSLSKSALYDMGADAFRLQDTTLHTFETLVQLQSIEGSSQNAPEGEHDDMAMSYMLALQARITRDKPNVMYRTSMYA